MQESNINAETLRRQKRKRSMTQRLWETYAQDLIEEINQFSEGRSSQASLHEAIDDLVPKMHALRPGGRLALAVDGSQSIILANLMAELNLEEPDAFYAEAEAE